MPAPMSEAELLAKLAEERFVVSPEASVALLTAWRDAAVRAEREACVEVAQFWGAEELVIEKIRARNTEPEQHG